MTDARCSSGLARKAPVCNCGSTAYGRLLKDVRTVSTTYPVLILFAQYHLQLTTYR